MTGTERESGVVRWVAGNRNVAGTLLMVLALAVGAGAGALYYYRGREFLVTELLLAVVALMTLLAGVWFRYRGRGAGSPEEESRGLILILGGFAGLVVTVIGLILIYTWWETLSDWLKLGKREGAAYILGAFVLVIVGLAAMFASMQVARSEVRQSQFLRRLLYGYNAVLTGILLFLILAVVNVLVYLKLPAVVEATETSFSRLSDKSANVLKAIEKPVTAYVVMSTESQVYEDIRALLANAQGYAPSLKVEALSPGLNSDKIRDLRKQFPQLTDEGILLVYGEGEGKSVGFVKADDMIKENSSPDGERSRTFEGENLIVTELSFLSEDRKKPVIYFANGNAGELDFNDMANNREDAVGILQRRLGKRNMEVKALKFDPVSPKVPDDATVVVIPGPKFAYPQPVADALKNYMDARKGKLIVLLGVEADRAAKTLPDTGLEGLFTAYKVQATKDRIITLPIRGVPLPLGAAAFDVPPEAERSKQPIVQPVVGFRLSFYDSRAIRPAEAGGNPSLRAEPLLVTYRGWPVILDSDLQMSPRQVVESLFKQGEAAVRARIVDDAVPMAVAVSESAPSMPGHPPAGAAKPRMVVFGNAKWVSNPQMDEQGDNDVVFSLFQAAVDWLREKPSNIGIESKQFKTYSLNPAVSMDRLVYFPALLAVVGIVGLGAGVWVARRR